MFRVIFSLRIGGMNNADWIYILRLHILRRNVGSMELNMNFLTIGISFEAAVPLANSVIGAASAMSRPLLGLGVFATLLVLFKPLITTLYRGGLHLAAARKLIEERHSQVRMDDQLAIDRYARSIQNQQPTLAAELRSIASRD